MLMLCVIGVMAGASFSNFRNVVAFGAGTFFYALTSTLLFATSLDWGAMASVRGFLIAMAMFQVGYLAAGYIRYLASAASRHLPASDAGSRTPR